MASPEIAKNLDYRVEEDTLGSDHHPLVVNFGIEKEENLPPKSQKYLVKKANWELFQTEAEKELLNCRTAGDPREDYQNFIEKLYTVCDRTIPKTNLNRKKKLHPAVPYWNSRCQAAINRRKRSLKKLHRNFTIENNNIYLQAKTDAKKQ